MSEKEEFEDMFKDYAEPMPDFEMVVEAANALYMAGRWSLENPQFGAPCEEHQITLWEDLRDALGHAPGKSTEAGVNPRPGISFVDANTITFPPGIIWTSDLEPDEPEVEIQSIPFAPMPIELEVKTLITYNIVFTPEPMDMREVTPLEVLNDHLANITSLLADIAITTEEIAASL